MKQTVLLLLVLILLTACGEQTADSGPQTADGGPQTAAPTATPTATLTPGLDELDPNPTETPTPEPFKPEDLLDQATYASLTSYGFKFGVWNDGKIAIYKYDKGARKNIGWLDREGLHFGSTEFQAKEDADGKMVDATRKTSAEDNVFGVEKETEDQATFTISETNNPLFPNGILTMTVTRKAPPPRTFSRNRELIEDDYMEEEVVYIWDDKHAEFVRKVEMGEDIEHPSYYAWDYEETVVASAILDGLDKPFPDEIVKAFKGGWAMNFEYDEKTDSSFAYLMPYGTEYSLMFQWALNENGKPIWFTTIAPDGTVYESILTQIFSPQNMENPQPDETMLILATAGEWWNGENRAEFIRNYVNRPDGRLIWKETLPKLILASKNGYFSNGEPIDEGFVPQFGPRPSLDALFKQKGNDLNDIEEMPAYLAHLNELGVIDPNTKKPVTLLAYIVAHLENEQIVSIPSPTTEK